MLCFWAIFEMYKNYIDAHGGYIPADSDVLKETLGVGLSHN